MAVTKVVGSNKENRNCICVGQFQLSSFAATKKLNRNALVPDHEDKFVALGHSESGMSLKKQVSGIIWVCINDGINILDQISLKERQGREKAYTRHPHSTKEGRRISADKAMANMGASESSCYFSGSYIEEAEGVLEHLLLALLHNSSKLVK